MTMMLFCCGSTSSFTVNEAQELTPTIDKGREVEERKRKESRKSRSLGVIIDHRTVAEVKYHFVTGACFFIGIYIYISISIGVLFALFHRSLH